jgi:polyhydroxybutyrate depolymerase
MSLGRVALVVPVFLGVAVISGYLVQSHSDDKRGKIEVDGRERTYALHVPANYDEMKSVPLLIALHGRLGTGSGEERLAHLDKVSDEHGFLVVYPDGLDRSWSDGRGGTPSDRNGVDDVKFLSALIDKIEGEYKVDHARIYATGMSNGGFMSGRLACDLSERIAAVAIVGASLSESVAAHCHPTKPISVMIIQGTEDPLVPFDGGALGKNGDRGVVLSHKAAVQKFVEVDHCGAEAKEKHVPDKAGDGTSIDVAMYGPCAGNSEVASYVINGGGHAWPGGIQYLPAMIIGKTTHNLDGSEEIWEFLSRHTR